MVIHKKPEVIWITRKNYYPTALDFFKVRLNDKEKEHINKIVDFETTYSEIMEAKEQMHTHADACGNCSTTNNIEKRHYEEWHKFTDDLTFFNGNVSDVDAEIMEWLVENLKGTYDYDWNCHVKGWNVTLMKKGEFD